MRYLFGVPSAYLEHCTTLSKSEAYTTVLWEYYERLSTNSWDGYHNVKLHDVNSNCFDFRGCNYTNTTVSISPVSTLYITTRLSEW